MSRQIEKMLCLVRVCVPRYQFHSYCEVQPSYILPLLKTMMCVCVCVDAHVRVCVQGSTG